MKTIFLIVVLFITSCKKDYSSKEPITSEKSTIDDKRAYEIMKSIYGEKNNPAARGTNQFYHVCAQSYIYGQEILSHGMAAEADVIKLRLGTANIKSWWIAFYYHYDTLGGTQTDWIQWGYAVSKDFGLFPAFFVYHISGPLGSGIASPLTINYFPNSAPLVYGTKVRFELKNRPGSTFWTCLRNGVALSEVDLHTDVAQGIYQSCTESWGDNSFPQKIHITYDDYFYNEQWNHLPIGIVQGGQWNLQGQNQIPAYQLSEHDHGGKPIANTYPRADILWGTP